MTGRLFDERSTMHGTAVNPTSSARRESNDHSGVEARRALGDVREPEQREERQPERRDVPRP
jgi:hypothetical protein